MRPTRLFGLYPTPNEAEMIERRLMADEPMENIKHRILGKTVKSASRFTKKVDFTIFLFQFNAINWSWVSKSNPFLPPWLSTMPNWREKVKSSISTIFSAFTNSYLFTISVSENFYFDMNNEKLRSMLENHPEYSTPEYSTTARSCVFDISQPSSDLFLVVKLEKVLQVSYFNSFSKSTVFCN